MAYAFLHLLLFLLPYLLPFSAVARTNGTIFVGSSITAGDKATPWLSPSGDFAFGFKQLQDKKLFWLSIWYQKIPDQTIVWYANQSGPAPSKSKVELTDRGLVLKNPEGNELWRSESIIGKVKHGFMNDTGNFVLVRGDSVNVWESFDYPADTLLPTQKMESHAVLYSRRSETKFSRGRFQLRLLEDGNLVLNARDMATDFAYDAYYISGIDNSSNGPNSHFQVVFNEKGYMYILGRNGPRFDLTPGKMLFPTTNYYHRATLNFDGVFTQYAYPKNPTDDSKWEVVWFQPDDICVAIFLSYQGSGPCGYNSICTRSDYGRPVCECPKGYSLLHQDDKYGSCKPDFTQGCEDDDLNSSPEDLYDFVELKDTDWPTSDYAQLKTSSEDVCRNSCLHDCFCSVAVLNVDSCWKKNLPLSNGRNSKIMGRAFIKFRKGDLPPKSAPETPRGPGKENNRGSLIRVGSALLGSSLFFNFLLIGALCLGFFLIYRQKSVKTPNGDSSKDPNLRCFTYKELDEATDGFKEELGRGGCGIVYKGVTQMGAIDVVAVKKLDRVIQEREKEFKTEVNAIGRTHHKNLVQLLGFCDEGQHRMLVYEFLSNGTLASFLFSEIKPNWSRRIEITLGIARGLLYLHEECSTRIIHCDIKPQNILLDDYCNARISDFGLAKLMMINQSKTNATIRGTKGYVAPEWFNKKPITAKVDVYSFGVLLLEIIACRRNVGDMENGEEEQAILTDWACDCYRAGRLDALVENDTEALSDWKKLDRFFMVAIWCIQDDPSLRPTMRKVNQMLEGVVEVARPPCPSQFSFTL